jgi:hypothetical protein
MIAWPIEIFLKGPWAHSEKTFKITAFKNQNYFIYNRDTCSNLI